MPGLVPRLLSAPEIIQPAAASPDQDFDGVGIRVDILGGKHYLRAGWGMRKGCLKPIGNVSPATRSAGRLPSPGVTHRFPRAIQCQ
jgi:hypothetical protein